MNLPRARTHGRRFSGPLNFSLDSRNERMGRGVELVNARLADLQARYRRGATAPPELLSPKSKATLGKLRRWSATAGGER
jgi:hypothetical protein